MDWRKIKTEYITTGTSYRKLCKKYGVSYTALSRRARAEGWPALKTQKDAELTSKVVNAAVDKQVDRVKRMQTIADALLKKIEEGVDGYDAATLLTDRQTLRQITGALRDLKDVLSLKSDIDLEEQQARIAKLRKDAAEDDPEDSKTEVCFTGGDVEEWSE